MSSLSQHIYAVKNILSSGISSDDFQFSNRLISHYLKFSRSILLKRKLDKYHNVSDINYQTMCIELALQDYSDCVPELDCKILKSTIEIPNSITTNSTQNLKVTLLDGTKIDNLHKSVSKYTKYSLSGEEEIYYFLQDGYLFITNCDTLPNVLVTGIFEDPIVADSECEDSKDFPLDADLVMPMYEMTINMLRISQRFPQDNRNDSRNPEQVNSTEPNEV